MNINEVNALKDELYILRNRVQEIKLILAIREPIVSNEPDNTNKKPIKTT